MLAKTCHNGCLLICLLLVAALGAAGCQGKVEGQPCGAGLAMCGGVCTPVANNAQNCGACGVICAAGQLCQANQCVCSPGLLSCNGSCVASNATHCGSCTTMCTGVEVCSNNTCMSSCPTGESQCPDGACVGPTGGDATHCGGCTPCPTGSTCNAGICMSVTVHRWQRRHRWRHRDGRHGRHRRDGRRLRRRCRRFRGGCGGCRSSSGAPRSRISSGLTTAPVLSNRGGQAAVRVLQRRDAGRRPGLPVRALPGVAERRAAGDPSRITTLAPCTGTTAAAAKDLRADLRAERWARRRFRRPLDHRRGDEPDGRLRRGRHDRLRDRHQPDRPGDDHLAVVRLSDRARPDDAGRGRVGQLSRTRRSTRTRSLPSSGSCSWARCPTPR